MTSLFDGLVCLSCNKAYPESGLVFQCHMSLCQGCHDALGGSEGVIALSRTIEEQLSVVRGDLVRKALAKAGVK